jgi:hypothetical protein
MQQRIHKTVNISPLCFEVVIHIRMSVDTRIYSMDHYKRNHPFPPLLLQFHPYVSWRFSALETSRRGIRGRIWLRFHLLVAITADRNGSRKNSRLHVYSIPVRRKPFFSIPPFFSVLFLFFPFFHPDPPSRAEFSRLISPNADFIHADA